MTSIAAARTHSSHLLPTVENQSAPATDTVDTAMTPQRPSQDVPLPSSPVPPLGNLGGALSWPMPLNADEQRRLRLITMSHAHHLGDQPLVMQTKGGVLEFLRYRQPLPASVQNDPAKMLEALVRSPQGQLMGKALQQRMQGIDSESSVTDYLLASIALQMDPESITAPDRHTIAGFDLASDKYWGHHPAAVVDGLAEHLSSTGKTSVALAKVGAYLLLAKSTPQFLIKDIPPNVKIGSLAWASLTIAAMTIEAQTPGKVPGMTFAQVMSGAEEARRVDPAVTQTAQTAALLDWAIASGVLAKKNDGDYLPAQLESVKTAFNAQLDTRLTASQALDTALPTRKEIALAKLKERFGDLGAFFEEKVFAVDQHYVVIEGGVHSLLDVAMNDWLESRPFKAHEPSSSLKANDLRRVLTTLNANPQFGVPAEFEKQFNLAIEEKKAAVNTTVRHMISQLPLEDRKHFEFGKISFFQEGSYVMDGHFNNTYDQNRPGLLVKTELLGKSQAYVIDFNKGTIERAGLYDARIKRSEVANKVFTTKAFTPRYQAADLGRERPLNHSLWDSFTSTRSHGIATAFVQHLELDDPAIKQQARGQTALDKANAQLSEFLLNLIPFRSAIVNFQNGKYGDGTFDLLLDVFGFLTAGTATSGKLLKVGRSALSAGARALKAAKVIGVATIEVLNPVGGVGDLVKLAGNGGLYLLSKGAKAVNKLRGANGSYDVLKATSRQYDAAATGVVKVAEQTVEGAAVLKNGHWYAFDADTMRPYGSPLEEFRIATRAVAGEVDTAHIDELSELRHELFGHFKVPDTNIAGLSRNSQGVYVAADGHLSHIRHTDSSGETAVYEVRQVSRTEDGVVQARVYHNNRQTELLVQHVQGDQWQRLGSKGGVIIDADHLRAWTALPLQEQQRITVKGFARQHKLHPPTFEYYLDGSGGLSVAGKIVHDRPKGTPTIPITTAHLLEWQGMTQQVRDMVTLQGFAGRYNLDLGSFRIHARQDGSRGPAAEALFFTAAGGIYTKITDMHLLQWSQLAQQPGNKVTPAAFRAQHNLSPLEWSWTVRVDGTLTQDSVRRAGRVQPAIPSTGTSTGTTAVPTRKRPASDSVDPPQEEALDLSTPRSPDAQTPGPSSAVSPVVIKVEASDFPTLPRHQIDNTLPILQDPANPRVSLTQSLEGPIEDIRIAYWNGVLDGLDSPTKARVSAQIKASIKDWLRTEGQHQARFDEALEVVTPLDDGGPTRGASVWARRDIPQYEVLGPYAGKYHPNEASLFEEQRKQGSRAVLTYLFGTRSGTRTVSGLHTGNTLSLINTSQLGNGPAWMSNNVVSIAVGKNLTFYVALKDIKKGEELLLDYGPLYKPVPDIAIKPDPDS
ncbi:SET domain-containing protein-lysine N-methyltransferase [Pseudomonas sp. AM4(2022)]|uniref:SET domain-containing protein-lysine N-methyltransferase n=2 Tax=Pseudomonas sp. AM4(2022) TaxID=2983408 RepID=UPI002E80B376|nr:SET domain-containing protein-lysine N-methyltransferase [Pseudomonas sp. AM4(2022)]